MHNEQDFSLGLFTGGIAVLLGVALGSVFFGCSVPVDNKVEETQGALGPYRGYNVVPDYYWQDTPQGAAPARFSYAHDQWHVAGDDTYFGTYKFPRTDNSATGYTMTILAYRVSGNPGGQGYWQVQIGDNPDNHHFGLTCAVQLGLYGPTPQGQYFPNPPMPEFLDSFAGSQNLWYNTSPVTCLGYHVVRGTFGPSFERMVYHFGVGYISIAETNPIFAPDCTKLSQAGVLLRLTAQEWDSGTTSIELVNSGCVMHSNTASTATFPLGNTGPSL